MRPGGRSSDAAAEGRGREVNGINALIYCAGLGVCSLGFWLGYRAGRLVERRKQRSHLNTLERRIAALEA